jgi:hypothetical protein
MPKKPVQPREAVVRIRCAHPRCTTKPEFPMADLWLGRDDEPQLPAGWTVQFEHGSYYTTCPRHRIERIEQPSLVVEEVADA